MSGLAGPGNEALTSCADSDVFVFLSLNYNKLQCDVITFQFTCTATNKISSKSVEVVLDHEDTCCQQPTAGGISGGVVVLIIVIVAFLVIGIPLGCFLLREFDSDRVVGVLILIRVKTMPSSTLLLGRINILTPGINFRGVGVMPGGSCFIADPI